MTYLVKREKQQVVHTHTETYTRIDTHPQIHTQTHAHTNTDTHIHKHRHTYTNRHTHTHKHTQTHAQVHTHTQTHTQTHVQAYTHIHKHIDTHTHTCITCKNTMPSHNNHSNPVQIFSHTLLVINQKFQCHEGCPVGFFFCQNRVLVSW